MASGVKWGGAKRDGSLDPSQYIGLTDPVEQTLLQAGETVAVCQRCNAAYHLTTLAWLRTTNRGACVTCQTDASFQRIALPGGAPPPPRLPPAPDSAKAPAPTTRLQTPEPPEIGLRAVRRYIDQDVMFTGRVVRVYESRGGSFFILFERTRTLLGGFHLVIQRRNTWAWEDAEIDPIVTYIDQWVRVRGVILHDPTWGLQMLVRRPEHISVVAMPRSAEAPSPPRRHATTHPFPPPVLPPAPAEPPRPRVRWLTTEAITHDRTQS